jgi:hypothetical protein
MADSRLRTTNAIATTVIMAMPVVRIDGESRHIAPEAERQEQCRDQISP